MKDLLPKLVIGFMVATTAATSAYAGMKLVESPQTPIVASSNSPKESSLKSQIESKIESFGEMFQMPGFVHNDDRQDQTTPTPTARASSSSTSSSRIFALASSSAASRSSISSTVSNNSNDCIVTLFGKQYKINSLLNSHSGGNIFNCGTDMSSTYQGKHGTNVSRMAQYLITTSASASTSNNSSTSTSSTASATTNSNDCIITLFGQQFKINSLLNSHSGGNIFNCGTDMTSVYQGRHGTSLSRMAKYAITSSGSTSGSGASSSSSGGSKHDDDDEGEREEDRYDD